MKRSGLIHWREHTLSILSCGWDVLAGFSNINREAMGARG